MEKVAGITPSSNWETLSIQVKKAVVEQVAEHLVNLFSARFAEAGSLYEAEDDDSHKPYIVGPIIHTPFYRMINGYAQRPECTAWPVPKPMRYPERTLILSETEDEDVISSGVRVMRKGIDLCYVHPGDSPIQGLLTSPGKPYTIRLEDFRLVNMLIDENTGHVNGYIDFEATTVPQWIPDPDSDTASWYGGTEEDQRLVWETFHASVDKADKTGEWQRAYERGAPFRRLVTYLGLGIANWKGSEGWIDERLQWVKANPGVGMPSP